MRVPEWASGIEARATDLRHKFDPLQEWAERSIFWKIWDRVLENEFVDRSVALAAKAFISLFPALIVVAAFAPHSVRRVDRHHDHSPRRTHGFEYQDGEARLRLGRRHAQGHRNSWFDLHLLLRQFVHDCAPPCVHEGVAQAPGRAGVGIRSGRRFPDRARRVLFDPRWPPLLPRKRPEDDRVCYHRTLASIGVWLLAPWLMLQRQVRWRVLLSGAVMTGVAMRVYAASASLWMPHTVCGEPAPVRVLRRRALAGHLAQRRGHHHCRERVRGPGARRGHGMDRPARTRFRLARVTGRRCGAVVRGTDARHDAPRRDRSQPRRGRRRRRLTAGRRPSTVVKIWLPFCAHGPIVGVDR